MKKLFISFLFSTFTLLSFAQTDFRPGYIVPLQGDTVKGEVNYKGDLKNALECTFRTNSEAKAEVYRPDQLQAYGFNGGKFYEAKPATIVRKEMNMLNKVIDVPVQGNGPVNFMQVLVKGTATLYFLNDAFDQTHYYLQKRDEPLAELLYLQTTVVNPQGIREPYRSRLYVGTLKVALKECVQLGSEIEKTDFKPSQLIDLVIKYNQCVAPTQKIKVQEKPRSIFTWGALAGMSFSKMHVEFEEHYLGHGEYNSKLSPTAGLFIDFTLPFINDKLSLNNAAFYTIRNYKADYNYATSDLSYSNYRVGFDFSYIRLETALRYTSPARKFTPFFQAGIGNSFMLSNNEEISSTKYYLNYPPQENQENDVITPIVRKHQLGIIGAAGLKHVLTNGNSMFLQTNYELNTGFTKASGIGTRSHNVAVLIGIGF